MIKGEKSIMFRSFRKTCVAFAAGAALLGSSVAALAETTTSYQVLVETRTDGTAPFEVFLASFASLDAVFAGATSPPTDFTDIAISPDYQIGGMTWDGSAYRVLVETRDDGTAPFEVFLASFATLDDVFAGVTSPPTDFTEIAISPDYQIAGLTWDGSAYRVLVETRDDGTAPFEVFLASFATLDDLRTGITSDPTDFTEIAISPDYQIADMTWDGSAYRVLVETRDDGTAPFEVFLASFATLDDLFAGITSDPTDFTEIAISPDYQIAGFSSVTTVTPPPRVPEPATWSLMIIGAGATGLVLRRRRVAVAA
jgi:hypothetical protein